MKYFSSRSNRGFTLVELLVSVGLFAMIMSLAAGSYLVITEVNRRSQAIALTTNSLAFTLETMTRSIRTGTQYGCAVSGAPVTGNNCDSGSAFIFRDVNARTITYTYIAPAGGANGYLQQQIGSDISQISDPSINISSFAFSVSGAQAGDATQANVRIRAKGTIDVGKGQTLEFSMQTGATMRNLDI